MSELHQAGSGDALLSVRGLKTYFPVYGGLFATKQGYVQAVNNVSFDVHCGETLGLVGESGCGKSTLAQTILRIVPATAGEVYFKGRNILDLSREEFRLLRKEIQIVFQDPFSTLDPRVSIGKSIEEPLLVYGMKDARKRREIAQETMRVVGLEPSYYDRFPHEFSGGQRQRVSIARSLILRPKLIFCDEPVSALDVSIQSQILNLLKRLQHEFHLTYVFISHALNVVRHVSDRVAVMYLGQIVEMSPSEELFEHPMHPYTQALISAIPIPDPDVRRERVLLCGDLPSPQNPPAGCRFHTRCPMAKDICAKEAPELRDMGGGHLAACHLAKGGI